MPSASQVADMAQKGAALFLLAGAVWMGTEATVMGYWTIKGANERITAQVGRPTR